jgi:hypothetical protein
MASEVRKAGRPRLDAKRRVRITTTIEPSKLMVLQQHAQRVQKSLGELADEYVNSRFAQEMGGAANDEGT